MDLKSLQTLKSKTALKKKNLIHRIIYHKKINHKVNLVTLRKPSAIYLQSIAKSQIFDNQLISLFKLLQKHKILKKKLYVRSFPFVPLTKKPLEVRMGKGKGKINNYCKPTYIGNILLEVRFNTLKLKKDNPFLMYSKEILKKIQKKFSFKTKIITQDF